MTVLLARAITGLPVLFWNGLVSFSWWDYALFGGFSIAIGVLVYNWLPYRYDTATRFLRALITTLALWYALPSICFAVGYVLPHPYRHVMTMDSLGHADFARQNLHWIFTLRETDGPGRYRFAERFGWVGPDLNLYHVRQNACFRVEGIDFPGGVALYSEMPVTCPIAVRDRS